MANPQPLVGDVINIAAEHLNLPVKFTRQVIAALKAADRIDSARPISPAPTPLSIARILLALASPTITGAVRHGERLGAMPLYAGDGQPNVERALQDIVEEAAGWRNGDTNFKNGCVILSDCAAFVGGGIYRAEPNAKGLTRNISIDNQSIAALTRDLLPFKEI